MNTTLTGTVKFFNSEKGFGFIKHDDSDTETFVHKTGLRTDVQQNDRVRFTIEEGRKGPIAVNVEKI
ncbi:MAG: cold-shock protein [Flavobacteriales bacterium]|nr:cold-shock protein [Flavobacteriales bacterium]HCA83807.1 cold-shock protein [Flavobacteriales bacterium]HRE75799.1 cold shock domain-containing protein [Flavobacteriales bacterium]HRE97621.1 cold shock domain-containing protein [Flavobacteriales bacterium]HRJ37164.1 cold shock domain-containing protein [Flavobacteriales bacterium]